MKSKIGTAMLSLAFAFVLWLFVITTVSPGSKETFYNIPVVMANESVLNERGLTITAQTGTTVTMELSGNRTDLSKVDSSKITLKADLATIYEPGNQIPLNYTVTFPGEVASNAFVIEYKRPGRIYVTVERRATKSVPLEVRWAGSVPDGFIADRDNMVLECDAIQITGPQSVTDKIQRAIIDLDLTDQRESVSQECLYTLCDEEGEPVDSQLIETNMEDVHLDVKVQRVKDIQLSYILVEGGGARAENAEIQLDVEKIRISGSEAALEMMGDQLVIGTINLAEMTEETTTKTFNVVMDDSITNLTGVTEVTATVRLTGLDSKSFTIRDIRAVNVPEGLEIDLITKELSMVVRGPAAEIASLTGEDIQVSVDFTGAEVGNFTFPVIAAFADGFENLGVLRSDSVSASVLAAGSRTTEVTEPSAQSEAVG